jgi:hypothetical protein
MSGPMMKWFFMALAAISTIGCGGFDTDDATAQCEALAEDLVSCTTTESFNQCVDCYEECGRDCQLADGACPHQFSCKD